MFLRAYLSIKPKQYSCCVPSCQTRGQYSSFLTFPSNPTICQQWISAIPNLDGVVDHKSLICIKHFKKGQVIHDGAKLVVEIGAVPTIFEQNPEENCIKKYFPKYMFETLERDVGPETFGDLENLNTEDFIVDFYSFKQEYGKKLGYFIMKNWHVSFAETYAFFYLLSLDHVAKIKCSIKINEQLLVQVALSGRIMDPLDMTWILPASSKITRWSQLKMLLFEFGEPGDKHIEEILPDLHLTPYLKFISN